MHKYINYILIMASLFIVGPITADMALCQSNEVFSQGSNINDHENDETAEQQKEEMSQRSFDNIMKPQNKIEQYQFVPGQLNDNFIYSKDESEKTATKGTIVEMDLSKFTRHWDKLHEKRKKSQRYMGPGVILGSSEYTGKAVKGALSLKLRLQVTLDRPNKWKTVPIIGDSVVLVRALVNNIPIPISTKDSYHVWTTKRSGEVTIEVDLLAPSHGPRGSIEYEFHIARTPVTKFSCRFPVYGLQPRLTSAVQSKSVNIKGGTLFTASLRPTTRIHLVGFKDMGEEDDRAAKVYAESMNLLSIDEDALELFSVIRYTILYSGTKDFKIFIPKGMSVVSADGMGAFTYTIQKRSKGSFLKGETAFPIRNNYEISLRLRRELKDKGEIFKAPLPVCSGVERESGWLGVEVPGKLQLEEKEQKAVQAVDVRQLPDVMLQSAVSPILKAYHYHSTDAGVTLLAKRLPEIEPSSGSIDRIKAYTKVTNEGKVITDMQISLRNRLRHSITLTLPEDTQVNSAMLDDQPLNLSKNKEGGIILPLKRSQGSDQLEPFIISVVLESSISSFWIIGFPTLSLPVVDLPVSSLAWSVYLPGRNVYSALDGDIEPQVYAGRVNWHQAVSDNIQANTNNYISVDDIQSSSGGTVPVRINIPKDGTGLQYTRYWIEEKKPVEISYSYLRSWVRIPVGLFLILLMGAGFILISAFFYDKPLVDLNPWLGIPAVIFTGIFSYWFGGVLIVVMSILLAIGIIIFYKKSHLSLFQRLKDITERLRGSRSSSFKWNGKIVVIGIGFIIFGLLLFGSIIDFVFLLFRPLT